MKNADVTRWLTWDDWRDPDVFRWENSRLRGPGAAMDLRRGCKSHRALLWTETMDGNDDALRYVRRNEIAPKFQMHALPRRCFSKVTLILGRDGWFRKTPARRVRWYLYRKILVMSSALCVRTKPWCVLEENAHASFPSLILRTSFVSISRNHLDRLFDFSDPPSFPRSENKSFSPRLSYRFTVLVKFEDALVRFLSAFPDLLRFSFRWTLPAFLARLGSTAAASRYGSAARFPRPVTLMSPTRQVSKSGSGSTLRKAKVAMLNSPVWRRDAPRCSRECTAERHSRPPMRRYRSSTRAS